MERSWDLALCDRTDVPRESRRGYRWKRRPVAMGSENVKALSSEGPRKWCVNEGSGGRGEWFGVMGNVQISFPLYATVILGFQRFKKPMLNGSHGGDCSPAGCQKGTLVPMTPKSTSKAPIPYACFLYDQTREYCWRWPETMEAVTGPVGDMAHTQEGLLVCIPGFDILTNDPWHPRWEMRITGELYIW